MADRKLFTPQTQGTDHVWVPVTILPQGSSTPLLGEGDAKGTYVSVARTGTGTFTVTTVNPYPGFVAAFPVVGLATPVDMNLVLGTPVHNSSNTWTVPFTLFNQAGTATDVAAAAGNAVYVLLVLRNSGTTP